MQFARASRIAAMALAGIGYVALTHWLMTRSPPSRWDVVGVFAPMLAAVAIAARRSGHRLAGAAAAALGMGLAVQAALGVRVVPAQALYAAQHVGIYLFLALAFGVTLRRGRVALITTLATRVHGGMTVPMARYTRAVTRAWTLFFVAIASVSLALFEFASFDRWALFANLLSPLAVAAMFGAEYFLRYRLHPEFERSSLAAAIRSYRDRAKPAAGSARAGPVA